MSIGRYNSTLPAPADGTICQIQVDSSGRLIVVEQSVIPGTGATNLGKAEDVAHASGDTGVMSLAVRQNTATVLSDTNADYTPLIVDAFGRLHTAGTNRPFDHGALGHYRTNHRCALVATQAANSRLFEITNTAASTFIIPLRLKIQWVQTGTHTAAIEDSLDVYRCTSFSAVDTTNTVTPVASVARTGTMAAAPGGAAIRGVTVAGASAGMTGGTLTKDTNSIGQLPQWLLAAEPTAGTIGVLLLENFADSHTGSYPFLFAQNEGLIIENRVLLGAAAASSVYIDFAWAEVSAF